MCEVPLEAGSWGRGVAWRLQPAVHARNAFIQILMAMPNRLPNIGIPIQQKLLNACSLLDSANNTKLYILYVSDNAKNDAVFMNMIYTITRQSTFTE